MISLEAHWQPKPIYLEAHCFGYIFRFQTLSVSLKTKVGRTTHIVQKQGVQVQALYSGASKLNMALKTK